MNETTCCFSGHRIICINTNELKLRLDKCIRFAIDRGFVDFLNGGANGFDALAGMCVLKIKKELPYVKLHVLVPCKNQSRNWSDADREVYNSLLSQSDSVELLSQNYIPGCMQRRNSELVSRSSLCICYFDGRDGGTKDTLNKCLKQDVPFLNTARSFLCAEDALCDSVSISAIMNK